MYSVDERDGVIELHDVPQSSVGAPAPVILSDERKLLLGYIIQDRDSSFSRAEHFALIEFRGYWSYMFGAPNDEAIDGHPLATRGLNPYGSFEVQDSSWIRQVERMNSVHPNHDPKRFDRYKHYVFAFHDSTFECIAEEFTISEHHGSFGSLITIMQHRLLTE